MPSLLRPGRRWKGVIASLAVLSALAAGSDSPTNAQAVSPVGQADPVKPTHRKLGSRLSELATLEAGSSRQRLTIAQNPLSVGQFIPVTIRVAGSPDEASAYVLARGGRVANASGEVVEAYVPAAALAGLENVGSVVSVREILPMQLQVTSQGATVHGAANWNAAGVTGQGVKVGVIDGGFGGYEALVGTEVPAPMAVRCYTSAGVYSSVLADCPQYTPHGTAVVEALVDMAPLASVYLAVPTSFGDFRSIVEWMQSQGVTVINFSAAYVWDGPGDGTSPFADSPLTTVNWAVANGVTFVAAAGNGGHSTWYGPFTDSNGDQNAEFGGTNDNAVEVGAGRTVMIQLRWQDSWTAASRDLDLYLYDSTGVEVARSADFQDGAEGRTPFEFLSYISPAGGEYTVRVRRYAGQIPAWMQLQAFSGHGLAVNSMGAYAIGNPAESASPGMLAVGATPWDFNTSIEPFSSQGPTPDGRLKPEVVGVDGADSVSYGPGGFTGTSQASPHVAGLAALVKQSFAAYTPNQVASYLKSRALARGGTVPNNTWGYGLAHLDPVFVLTLTRSGTGTGTVTSVPAGITCGTQCAALFQENTGVTLSATPAAGSVFTGWAGGGCSGAGTCTATMTAPTTVDATFVLGTTQLGITPSGGPWSAPAGSTVQLAATVAPATVPASTGITVRSNLTALGGTASQTFYDDGTHGDALAGDLTFSLLTPVPDNLPAGVLLLPVTASDAQGRTATTTLSVTVQAPTDVDGDGLPDPWELKFGLSPSSASGDDGRTGDPDADGATNEQELAAGTHPRGLVTRYFAEGATSQTFFDQYFAFLNPDPATDAHVLLRFMKGDGSGASHYLVVPALRRLSLDAKTVMGLDQAEFSTAIESDAAVVIDRTMSWDGSGYGGHAETSIAAPARDWYLAEGATHWNFDLFYTIQNPNAVDATVTVRYLRPSPLPPVEKTYVIPRSSRHTMWVDNEEFPAGSGNRTLAATDVSARFSSDLPIIVERSMYVTLPNQYFGAGHNAAALNAPATSWFLAEGATGTYFDLYITIANPTSEPALVTARFLRTIGGPVTRTYEVAAESRFNIYVNSIPGLHDTTVSTVIESTNGVPLIVERAMWWPGPTPATWHEAHVSAGSTAAGSRWGLAEGEQGGARGAETYICIANTSSVDGQAKVSLVLDDGVVVEKTIALPANSRTTVYPPAEFPATFTPGSHRRFGTIVESLGGSPVDIVVERAMYWNAGGVSWAAGTGAMGTRLPVDAIR